MRPEGRWTATARFRDGFWRVTCPQRVGSLPAFTDRLFELAAQGSTLAGFDCPIGLPAGYGEKTGFQSFRDAFRAFGTGSWRDFFDVAGMASEIHLTRPFYPARPGGTARQHLLDGHGIAEIGAITRVCERGGPGLKAAGCMFWTLGANQVGKAALHGWQNVIRPAVLRGANLWPFDGDLDALAAGGGVTLAETYPGDAYGQIGLSFKGLSKRRQSDRAALAPSILALAEARAIWLDQDCAAVVRAGFPADAGQDDAFDALVGLLAMIAVVAGERPDGAPPDDAIRLWEGWILGRAISGA